ncbi:branched-chain amino acid aminotransferase [Ornithinibacillus halotolerans]|uniref:Branched-chain amino acid aminotransferase n=1 Tax=Ornithinibacillus halotolerans TaxID=1274357 RepID=A0A916SBW3_9BACI|nr:branched-chain amino acid aminotransferase [Ornithinibacillus halotolerans]GGA90455.1 hypothetical protein GCM10008025_36250 [Ornithinibacillus halotolerans]
MLQKRMKQYITRLVSEEPQKIELYQEEMDYLKSYALIPNELTLLEKDPKTRFKDAYLERCNKETEETLSIESFAFLEQPIDYLQKQKNEFLYLESNWFELIGVDAVSLEVSDVFGTYDVLVGLKMQQKFQSSLKETLSEELQGDDARFELIFNQKDGMWDLNIALDYVEEFNEEITLEEAFLVIYQFLFKVVDRVEERSRT